MTAKRKYTRLSIDDRYDIVAMRESGVPQKVVMKKYGISLSTVRSIYSQKEIIKNRFESKTKSFSANRKCTWQRITGLEEILYHWFIQCTAYNVKISGTEIRRKAVEINEKLNFHTNFRGSNGWMHNFRERYCITSEDISRDFPAPSEGGVNNFKAYFKKYLQDGGYELENVYNVVYIPMMWKSVPEGSSILERARATGNEEMCEDHVTALFCVNGNGHHKFPVLIIGSVEENRRIYNFNTTVFSTIYRSNSNAWMSTTIFNEWFEEYFLKSVKERQESNGRRMKTLLLFDNVRSLHNLNDLNKKDEFVTVMSIPVEVPQNIQPINCGIIVCFMRKYRKELVKTIQPLPMHETEEEVIDLHKELGMWDCCRIVHTAWSKIDSAIIKSAWNMLLNHKFMCSIDPRKVDRDISKTFESLRTLPGCQLCTRADVEQWIEVDKIDKLVMKICTDEVIRDFKANTLGKADADDMDDEAGPSYA